MPIIPFALLFLSILITIPFVLIKNYCNNYAETNIENLYFEDNELTKKYIPIYFIDSYNKENKTILIINPDNKLYLDYKNLFSYTKTNIYTIIWINYYFITSFKIILFWSIYFSEIHW